MKLCFIVNRKISDSFPIKPTEAAPTAIDCGDIIFPVTPPQALALTVITGSIPIASDETRWSLQNKAFEEVSDPVIKTPNQPRIGEKNGNRNPVLASARAMVMDIPELFAIKANPTIDVIVIMLNLN